jgi:hypothetical protein
VRASTAVSLLLVSSVSIFGLFGRHHTTAHAGVEPVWVNGQMGVYNPYTHEFVPSTSPLFDITCDMIQDQRDQAAGGSYGSVGYHHWYYNSGTRVFGSSSYGSMGGATGAWESGGSSYGGSSSSFGSERGGFGETGHSHGGHGGGE